MIKAAYQIDLALVHLDLVASEIGGTFSLFYLHRFACPGNLPVICMINNNQLIRRLDRAIPSLQLKLPIAGPAPTTG